MLKNKLNKCKKHYRTRTVKTEPIAKNVASYLKLKIYFIHVFKKKYIIFTNTLRYHNVLKLSYLLRICSRFAFICSAKRRINENKIFFNYLCRWLTEF